MSDLVDSNSRPIHISDIKRFQFNYKYGNHAKLLGYIWQI
jgi:hypothetical protein